MLYNKEAAIAAIAIMLVVSPFLGGFLLAPAFAAQEQIASKTITQGASDTTIVDSITFDAKKLTMRTTGTVYVNIMQGQNERASSTIISRDIEGVASFTPVTVDFDSVQVQGSYNVTVLYEGSGSVTVVSSSIKVNAGPETAGSGGSSDDETSTAGDSDSQQAAQLQGTEITRKSVSKGSDQETDISSVEFSARKLTVRTSGDIIVAVVQGNNVVETDTLSAADLDVVNFKDLTANFDSTVRDDFEIVILFDGRGTIVVNGNVDVVGSTGTASDDDSGNGATPDPSQTVKLTVNAIDQDNHPVTDLWVAVMQEATMVDSDYTPHEFTVPEGQYTVLMDDYTDGTTTYTFNGWDDSSQDKTRDATLVEDETFTAKYIVTGPGTNTSSTDTPPGGDDTPPTGGDDTTPPATGTDGAVTITTSLLDDSSSNGFQVQLRDPAGTPVSTQFSPAVFDQMEDGKDYKVVMYSANNKFFRHWSDGGLHRYRITNTADEGKVFNGEYESVPADQAAHIMVIAKTSDGTVIGGTTGTDTDGTLSAESGLEVTVAPPGTMTPYTAGFSGGSEVSEHFYFLKGHIYTVVAQEFAPYTFSHWEDNNSENRARAVDLNGDVTLVAIYNQN